MADLAAQAPDRTRIVAIGGPVAVGKSSFADDLAGALRRTGRRVEVVSADGFLLPNARLAALGLMNRKGFPESYDAVALEAFFAAVADGADPLRAPVYSHEAYDVSGQRVFARPEVLVFEGLHALAWPFDLGIYLDADEADLEAWYVARFLALERHGAPRLAGRLAEVGGDPVALARSIWAEINLPNLRRHIAPTRDRADVVIEKGPDHAPRAVSRR